MLISRRRLQFAFLSILALMAIGLLAPARERLLAWAVSGWVGKDASVARAALFPDRSLVLIEGIECAGASGGWESRVAIGQCWLQTDTQAFRDGIVAIPRAQCDDVRLQIQPVAAQARSAAPAGSAAHIQDWHVLLAQYIATADWQELRSHCRSLLAVDQLNATWTQRINHWLSRSQAIINEVRSINSRAVEANPLRDTNRIARDLARAQQLLVEQGTLVEQFDGLQRLLDAEAAQLTQQFDAELQQLESVVLDGAHGSAVDTHRWAATLVRRMAERRWETLRPFVVAAVRLPLDVGPNRWNAHDLLVDGRRPPWLDVGRCNGAGIAELPNSQMPFRFSASWSGGYRPARPQQLPRHRMLDRWWPASQSHAHFVTPDLRADWTLQFGTSIDRVIVHSRVALPSEQVSIVVWGSPQISEASPSDRVVRPWHAGMSEMDEAFAPTLVLASGVGSASRLELTLNIHRDEVEAVLGPSKHSGSNATDSHDPVLVRAQLRGEWQHVEPIPPHPIPAWLASLVAERIRKLSSDRIASEKAQLQREFQARMEKTAQLIQTVASRGRQVMLDHHQQLAALGEAMRVHHEALTETEFARRPGADMNR